MTNSDINAARPLSPHLSIYKPIPTMMFSILHRITGAALFFGTLLLTWWLIGAASGEAYYQYVSWFMGSIVGRLILLGFTWALFQHMLGGIKHLFWDMGYGFDKDLATKIAWSTLAGSILLTFITWFAALAF